MDNEIMNHSSNKFMLPWVNYLQTIICRGDIMNAKLFQGLMFLTPLCFVLFVTLSYGQESLLLTQQVLQAQIFKQKELVNSWEVKANIEFFLAMLVVVLGAIVALLQKVDGKKWCSYVVAISGILISTLTFATKEYFEVDHKTYRRSAATAIREINIAEIYLAEVNNPESDPQQKKELLKEVGRCLYKIKSIEESLEKASSVIASSKSASNIEFFNVAYAQQSSRPAWVSQPKTETSTSYLFVGIGTAPSADTAKSIAFQNAQNAMAQSLSVPLNLVQQYAILADTFLEYNSGQRTFICYAMVELNKAFIHR